MPMEEEKEWSYYILRRSYMVVEYIIVLAIIMVMITFVFPNIKHSIQNMANDLADTTSQGEPVKQVTKTVSDANDSGIDMSMVIGIGVGIFVIAIVIMSLSKLIKASETEESKKPKQEKTDALQDEEEKQEPKTEKIESKKEESIPKTWRDTWHTIKEEGVLEEAYIVKIENIEENIENVITYAKQEHWQEDMHNFHRMKDEEIPRLVENYLSLSPMDRKREESRFDRSLSRMETEISRTKERIQNQNRSAFEQTVRVIEERYDK